MVSLEHKMIKAELIQRREEGGQTESIEPRIQDALERRASDEEFSALYEELVSLSVTDSSPYREPSTLEEIRAERPDGPRKFGCDMGDDDLFDCIYGAWLGRAAGCALGKPVEGWPKARIEKYLGDMGALPLDDYIPFHEKLLPAVHKPSTRNNISYMDRDDDMDFPILGLLALERQGSNFGARTMAHVWLEFMPFSTLYTAENAAYRNFVMSRWPPDSASFRNPFREWIGAQIGADIFGYVSPPSTRDLQANSLLSIPGLRLGKTGIEQSYEDILRGKSGSRQLEVDSVGRLVRELDRKETNNLYTSDTANEG